MKLYKLLPLLFSFAIISSATAQRFEGGFHGGLSTSQIDGDTQSGYDKIGAYGGVFVQTGFNDFWGAKIELMYKNKGARQVTQGVMEYKTSLHYVEMPFMVTMKPLKKLEFGFGLSCSYLISYKVVEGSSYVVDELRGIHDFDFSPIISATWFVNDKVGLNVNYQYSMLPIKREPHYWYNNNLCFGVLYKIK